MSQRKNKKFELSLLQSTEQSVEAFQSLKKSGLIFSPHERPDQLGEDHRNSVRLAFNGPEAFPKDGITSGPFPLIISKFAYIKKLIQKDRMAAVILLAFTKIQYERIGNVDEDFRLATEAELHDSEDFRGVLNLVAGFNLEEPVVTEKYAWFYPSDKLAIGLVGKRSKYNNCCWHLVLKLEGDIEAVTKKPQEFSLIPNSLADEWGMYLPYNGYAICTQMYYTEKNSKIYKSFPSEKACISSIANYMRDSKSSKPDPDREFLLYELYLLNAIDYPISARDFLNFFLRMGLFVKENARIVVSANLNNPRVVFKKKPKGWDKRAKSYIQSGSVLFDYLRPKDFYSQ